MKNQNELIELGLSARPHGIKGGILFNLYNRGESVLKNGSKITLFPKSSASIVASEGEIFIISSIHFGNKVICYLEGIKDRNIVEKMLPFSICYPRSDFPELEKDEWYIADLVGLSVFNQDGYQIGKVEGHFDNGAQFVLKIKLQDRIIELPFVDAFFPYVDIEKNKIVMVEPEYD